MGKARLHGHDQRNYNDQPAIDQAYVVLNVKDAERMLRSHNPIRDPVIPVKRDGQYTLNPQLTKVLCDVGFVNRRYREVSSTRDSVNDVKLV